uniref:G-protein coupled receptors family 1 profile domain-containing protein n=1 Tax=Plectus sambesii TaxID=2011161 RepID=A0A914X223_9BILA
MTNESLLESFISPYTTIHLPLVITICVFGIVANVLNVIVLTRRQMRAQPINIILTGLSTAQLLLLVNFICYTAYSRLLDAQCAVGAKSFLWLSYLLLNVNLNLVLHTIALVHTSLLAVIRYLVVHFPNRRIITLFRLKMTVASCWLFVPLLCASFYTNSHVARLNLSDECADWTPDWNTYKLSYSANHRQMAFNFWLFAIACKVLPCLCLTILSLLLVRDMKKAQKRRLMLRNASSRKDYLKVDRQHLSVTTMLLTIVALFIIVELPQGLLNVLQALASQGIIFRNFDYTSHIYLPLGDFFEMLTVLYSGINFVLYCGMSGHFRDTFKLTFHIGTPRGHIRGCGKSQSSVAGGDESENIRRKKLVMVVVNRPSNEQETSALLNDRETEVDNVAHISKSVYADQTV